jgi:hypothetical protein
MLSQVSSSSKANEVIRDRTRYRKEEGLRGGKLNQIATSRPYYLSGRRPNWHTYRGECQRLSRLAKT